ncbi:MAG: hypothetical protein JXQ73_06295 [Phycisphaerae bacterium]|nr:hypothetical protein [Phycisphaerae bacterium]
MTYSRLPVLLAAVVLFGGEPSLAEPLRGIELNPDAPESAVATFAKGGINALVIDFRRQADLTESSFVESVARWGKLAKRYGLRCYLAVRLFGPSDYTGAKGNFVGGVEGITFMRPCVCPADGNYWEQVVVPRVRRIGELGNEHGLAGALFDYQATLSGNEYNYTYCFSDLCWHAFIKARHAGDDKLLKMDPRARVSWVRRPGNGASYYAFLTDLVRNEMAKAIDAAQSTLAGMELGVYGFWDTWFYRGIAGATTARQNTSPAVMAELERTSLGQMLPLLTPDWERAGLRLQPVARLPLDYYGPADVQNEIAGVDRDRVGFLLTATDALWRRKTDDFHVYPPNGSPAAFASAVREGLEGERTGPSILFNETHILQYMPRVGLVHGGGLSAIVSGLVEQLAGSYQIPTLRLDARHPERWSHVLSFCKAIVVLPGAAGANPEALAAAAPAFERYVKNGGILIVLNAASTGGIDWLAHHDSAFACEGERRFSSKQAWLDNEGRALLGSPILIGRLPPAGVRFKSFSPRYRALAKDDEGRAYLLAQDVGCGTLLAAAGPLIPFELLANAYFRQCVRGEIFRTGLLPEDKPLRFGANDLVLGVAEVPETAVNVNVLVDVIGTNGDRSTHELFDVSIAGDGLRVPICYQAADEGAGRIIVTITDPVDGSLLCRRFIRLLHDERVEILPDKNYYTTEPNVLLRLRYVDASLRSADVRFELDGRDPISKLTGDSPRFAEIPIAALQPGDHKLDVAFLHDGQPIYARSLTVRKELPYPFAAKTLRHRNCLLEVAGKPFFAYGCIGGMGPRIEATGANTTIGGEPGATGKLRCPSWAMKGWALGDEWPADKVQAEVRGEKYRNLLLWYMDNEPMLHSRTPEYLRTVYEKARAKDPYHPQMIVYLGSGSYPHYPDLMSVTDIQTMNHYPLPYWASDTFAKYLGKLVETARGRRTVWAAPQCFDWREIGVAFGPYRKEDLHPSKELALNYVYQSVIEGASALTFSYTHQYISADPRRYGPFLEAVTEGAKLADIVTKGEPIPSPVAAPLGAHVCCRAFRVGDEIYVVAANYLPRKADVMFDAPYLKGKTWRRHLPEASEPMAPRDTLEPLEGKVYVIAAR